ncbi:MAG: RIP metalloprotease RseP [Pseudomonadota bacterium]
MDLIASIPMVGGLLSVVIPFIIAISIVVFVHELGHLLVGRMAGIHARKFSIGFGPALIARTDRHGTVWQVAAIPLGGMVLFLGEADGIHKKDEVDGEESSTETAAAREERAEIEAIPEELREKSFDRASVAGRAATIFAGPFFNFVLAAILFAGVALWSGIEAQPLRVGELVEVPGQPNELELGDEILAVNGVAVASMSGFSQAVRNMETPAPVTLDILRDGREMEVRSPYPLAPVVAFIQPFSAASRAGIQPDDLIQSVNGTPIMSFRELLEAVETSEGNPLALGILRDGRETAITLAPEVVDTETVDGFEKRYRIGVGMDRTITPALTTPGPVEAIRLGVTGVWQVISVSGKAIKHLFLGNLGLDNIQGPIGIAQLSGEQAKLGVIDFVQFVGVISVSIGFLNLFPIPILDGGRLVFIAYEAVVGRPPPDRLLDVVMPVGLAMVLLLMLFATYNDLIRLAANLTS